MYFSPYVDSKGHSSGKKNFQTSKFSNCKFPLIEIDKLYVDLSQLVNQPTIFLLEMLLFQLCVPREKSENNSK